MGDCQGGIGGGEESQILWGEMAPLEVRRIKHLSKCFNAACGYALIHV